MVPFTLPNELRLRYNRLHNNDGHILRFEFGVRRQTDYLDGLRPALRLLRALLRRSRKGYIRDMC